MCTFNHESDHSQDCIQYHYTCTAVEAVIKHPRTITTFIGRHMLGCLNKDVKNLWFLKSVVEFWPYSLDVTFPGLRTLKIIGCGLKAITKNDLKGLHNLEHLNLSGNKLKTLSDDLFEDMTKLRQVNFSNNLLDRLSSQVLRPLEGILKEADFRGNPAINVRYIHENGFDAFLENLDNHQPQPNVPKQPKQPKVTNEYKPRFDKEEEYFESGEFSDFTIKVRGKEFKVHKFILAAQSPIFERMFKNEALEGEQTLKNASNISENAFVDFLRYFYNGGLIKNEDNAMELFDLASEFEVANLKSESVEIILKKLNESNVIEVYNLGHHHGSDKLKQAAFKAIQEIAPGTVDDCIDEKDHLNKLIASKREFDNLVQTSKDLKKCERSKII